MQVQNHANQIMLQLWTQVQISESGIGFQMHCVRWSAPQIQICSSWNLSRDGSLALMGVAGYMTEGGAAVGGGLWLAGAPQRILALGGNPLVAGAGRNQGDGPLVLALDQGRRGISQSERRKGRRRLCDEKHNDVRGGRGANAPAERMGGTFLPFYPFDQKIIL